MWLTTYDIHTYIQNFSPTVCGSKRVIRPIYHVQILIHYIVIWQYSLMSDFTAFKLHSSLALLFFIDFSSCIHSSLTSLFPVHLSIYISFFSLLVRRQIEKFRNINSLRGQTRITRLPSKPGRWISIVELLELNWKQFFVVTSYYILM